MNSFSEEWLRLREPYDARARSSTLASELAAHISGRNSISFADFGCGTGANLRYTALALPPDIPQYWRLIDHDRQLLAAARSSLVQWADRATEVSSGSLRIEKDERRIEVAFCEAELARGVDAILRPNEIATASALFDLVSPHWIERFVTKAASVRAIVYAALIYNGREARSPPHLADRPMLAAFHAHQRLDKGFGAAAGPRASTVLAEGLSREGYKLSESDSFWQLDKGDSLIIQALAEGSAAAVASLNLFDEAAILDWKQSRKRAATCIIGHTDILAIPPSV